MNKNENIEFKRMLDILNNKKRIIALILILFIALGYLYSYYYVVPEYKSTSTLLLIPNDDETVTSSDLTLNSGLISTYGNIAKNSKVLKQVINNLNLNIQEGQLLSKIEINIIKDTHIMEISVSDTDPQMATNITKELSNVFLNEIKQIYNLNNIGIVDEAQLPDTPYNINHIKDMFVFVCMGIVVSFAYIVIIYLFDNTIKKEEDIKPEHIKDYVNVLDSKSKRLKVLIEDLFEASKASSGNLELNMEKIDITQLLRQAIGEMEEKLSKANLDLKLRVPEEKTYIMADGKKLYRVLENLLSNISKYSLNNTRVYIDIIEEDDKVKLLMKNISSYELNFDPEEIMERFKRADESRNTEGSGLGLAIARDLVNAQGGRFEIDIDGDLFKSVVEFNLID